MVPIWFQTGDKIGPDIVSEARSVSESILNQFEIDFGSILQPFWDDFDGHVAGYDPRLATGHGCPTVDKCIDPKWVLKGIQILS